MGNYLIVNKCLLGIFIDKLLKYYASLDSMPYVFLGLSLFEAT